MSVSKPDMRRAWANNGASVKPSDEKIDLGWIAEKPPYQNENWIQRRSDEFIQHINIEGIPKWSATDTYEINSIVKGSNGKVYISNSNPNLNLDPVSDILGNWTEAPQRKTEIIDLVYPIGSVHFSVNAANPSTYFGGTWIRIAEGRVIVGQQDADPLFDIVEETGGSKNSVVVSHSHTENSVGSHTHTAQSAGAHTHTFNRSNYANDNIGSLGLGADGATTNYNTSSNGDHTHTTDSQGNHSHTINSTGVSGTNANIQPYLVTYIWKRTA